MYVAVIFILSLPYEKTLETYLMILLDEYIVNWITRKSGKYLHTEKLDSCLALIKSHQLCIPWPPPLEIEPVTQIAKPKLQLRQQFISQTSDAKLTSQSNCAANYP